LEEIFYTFEERKKKMKVTSKKDNNKDDKRLKNLVPIKKGEVRNPTGRPKLPEEIRAMKEASIEQLISSYHKFAFTNLKELNSNPPVNLIEQGVRQTLSNFANSGEVDHISKIWDRVLGKPLESIDVTSKGESITSGEKLSPEERRMLIDKLRSDMGANNG
jgi:hypothetical protein